MMLRHGVPKWTRKQRRYGHLHDAVSDASPWARNERPSCVVHVRKGTFSYFISTWEFNSYFKQNIWESKILEKRLVYLIK